MKASRPADKEQITLISNTVKSEPILGRGCEVYAQENCLIIKFNDLQDDSDSDTRVATVMVPIKNINSSVIMERIKSNDEKIVNINECMEYYCKVFSRDDEPFVCFTILSEKEKDRFFNLMIGIL